MRWNWTEASHYSAQLFPLLFPNGPLFVTNWALSGYSIKKGFFFFFAVKVKWIYNNTLEKNKDSLITSLVCCFKNIYSIIMTNNADPIWCTCKNALLKKNPLLGIWSFRQMPKDNIWCPVIAVWPQASSWARYGKNGDDERTQGRMHIWARPMQTNSPVSFMVDLQTNFKLPFMGSNFPTIGNAEMSLRWVRYGLNTHMRKTTTWFSFEGKLEHRKVLCFLGR